MISPTKSGFTLIEMALALIIVGILTSGAARVAVLVANGYTQTENIRTEDTASTRVIGEAAQTGRIPATLSAYIKATGHEKDAYGTAIAYIPATELTTQTVCSRTSTSLNITFCKNSSCTSSIVVPDVAFASVSAGANRNMQTAVSPIVVPYRGSNADRFPGDGTVDDAMDDHISYTTLNELRSSARCNESPLRVMNSALPIAKLGTAYSAAVFASGGSGSYRWCAEGNMLSYGFSVPMSSINCSLIPVAMWYSGSSFTLSGTPSATGTVLMKVHLRDTDMQYTVSSLAVTTTP